MVVALRHLTVHISFLFVTAFAVLFVHLLFLAEGAKRACPDIANVTINVLTFPASLAQEEPGNFLSLNVIFTKIGRSAVCNCKLHEIQGEEGRRVKAEVQRCEYNRADQ